MEQLLNEHKIALEIIDYKIDQNDTDESKPCILITKSNSNINDTNCGTDIQPIIKSCLPNDTCQLEMSNDLPKSTIQNEATIHKISECTTSDFIETGNANSQTILNDSTKMDQIIELDTNDSIKIKPKSLNKTVHFNEAPEVKFYDNNSVTENNLKNDTDYNEVNIKPVTNRSNEQLSNGMIIKRTTIKSKPLRALQGNT